MSSARNESADLEPAGRPLARTGSGSFIGTIKTIITKPLSWFSSQESDFEEEDVQGKRRRTAQPERDAREVEEGGARAKRKRIHSPEPDIEAQVQVQAQAQVQAPVQAPVRAAPPRAGYLDVPESLIAAPSRPPPARPQPGPVRTLSLASRTETARRSRSPAPRPGAALPIDPPPRAHSRDVSMEPAPMEPAAPEPVAWRETQASSRASTIEPPSSQSSDSAYVPSVSTLVREASTESAFSSRAGSVGPSFTLRSSLTPQPSGQGYGPKIVRPRRDPSEPPPLTTLLSKPAFVRPPQAHQRSQSLVPEALRSMTIRGTPEPPQSQPPAPALIDRSLSMPSAVARPVNPAELALQNLNVYKVPLLPTRLREMRSRPLQYAERTMRRQVEVEPRSPSWKPDLDLLEKKGRKGKERKKPYAGEGGVKRMLARVREEEEEERLREHEDDMEDDSGEEQAEVGVQTQDEIPPLPAEGDDSASRPLEFGREPKLRVGRPTQSRDRIDPHSRSKNRFSAAFTDEDDEDEIWGDEGRAAASLEKPPMPRPAPRYQPPAGFSFSKEAPPIRRDANDQDEDLPIPSLPFAFNKPAADSVAEKHDAATGAEIRPSGFVQTGTKSTSLVPTVDTGPLPASTAPAPATPILKAAPAIALTPPTPLPAEKSALSEPAASTSTASAPKSPPAASKSGPPNFFASSAFVEKHGSVALPPGGLFGKPSARAPAADQSSGGFTTSIFGSASSAAPSAAQDKPASEPKSTPAWAASLGTGTPVSAFGAIASSSDPSPSTSTGLTGSSTGSSLFGNPPATTAAPATTASAPSLFGGASEKPAEKPATSTSFSFGAPEKSADKSVAPTSFSFGATETPAEKPATSTAFSFGAPEKPADKSAPSTAFSFGASDKPADKPATSTTFSFGAPAKPAENAAAPGSPAPLTRQLSFGAPSPVGDGTGGGSQPSSPFTSVAATRSVSPAPPPLSLGAPAASNEPPKFTFGAPKQEAPDASKGTFAAPAEPAKPPAFGSASGSGFGSSGAANADGSKPLFAFGQSAAPASPAAEAPKSPFLSAGSGGFSLGTPASSAPASGSTSAAAPVFSFGGASAPQPASSADKPSLFGSASASGTSAFGTSFGTNAGTDKPFAFASTTPRTASPPRNDQEVSMDESPSRGPGMDTNGNGKEPLKVTTSFSFGSSGPASGFGSPASGGSSANAFGAPAASTSSLFGSKTEVKTEKPSTGFSFGSSSGPTSAFGAKAPEPAQSSSVPTAFGSSSSNVPAFTFSQAPSSGPNIFAAAAPSSNPTSPAFSAPAFSFGTTPTSATAPSSGFSFGSTQPTSPAIPNSRSPSASGSTNAPTFVFGQSANAPPTAFGAPSAPGAPGTPGAEPPLFVMGSTNSSSTSTTTGPHGRMMKKLPTRRGGKR
ncbi:hypothetical protein WOLCODRAFT_142692 [Wolfiporia cocos MD-104 SS10]|uniref:Nuclear pore complex NUP2/50/61 domain-containing protein n=1 Tax=Wolfiporia cocos (strain MD-104) TaxID=742152 RepID=A0A2H3JLU5_WOLCO|nr:hypothetical protein WOLCODRAFT_142692 [Wolfiporia cocos MD-104 SS10]